MASSDFTPSAAPPPPPLTRAPSNMHATSSQTPSQPPVDIHASTHLIARAEALNAFMRMQPAANQARMTNPTTTSPSSSTKPSSGGSCKCFGKDSSSSPSSSSADHKDSHREYYPDNLARQPAPHPWAPPMEWLIVACIDLLEGSGLHERNVFAVSAVEHLVRSTSVPLCRPLPTGTDPHVAAGVIKAQIRHADAPLVPRAALRAFIDAQNDSDKDRVKQKHAHHTHTAASTSELTTFASSSSPSTTPPTQTPRQQSFPADVGATNTPGATVMSSSLAAASHSAPVFRDTMLNKSIDIASEEAGNRRAYILARFMRLLGRVSANVETSRMNAHSLAKCVAPSMLHWDPNSTYALLMLGRITAYVMTMIEDARVFDENLCQKIDALAADGGF